MQVLHFLTDSDVDLADETALLIALLSEDAVADAVEAANASAAAGQAV